MTKITRKTFLKLKPCLLSPQTLRSSKGNKHSFLKWVDGLISRAEVVTLISRAANQRQQKLIWRPCFPWQEQCLWLHTQSKAPGLRSAFALSAPSPASLACPPSLLLFTLRSAHLSLPPSAYHQCEKLSIQMIFHLILMSGILCVVLSFQRAC